MSLTDPDPLVDLLSKSTKKVKPSPAEITNSTLINAPERTRLLILLSFPILFLLAVPFWWYTTSIERLPLPTHRIDVLGDTSLPDIRTKILFTADAGTLSDHTLNHAHDAHDEVLRIIGKDVEDGIDAIYQQRRVFQRTWDFVYEDDALSPLPLRVHIRRWHHAKTSFPLEPYVQLPESGLMSSGLPAGTLVIPVSPTQTANEARKDHYKQAIMDGLTKLYPPVPPDIPLRALKYSPNITLSFVLLNENAADGSYVRSWDIEDAVNHHFIPHLEPLKSVYNFTIESQLLYHAPLSFEPTFGPLPGGSSDETNAALAVEAAKSGGDDVEAVAKIIVDEQVEQAWLIDEDQMKVFVNSEKWSLDSGSTNNPVLRFLLYVPAAKHRPLRLASPDSAQSFLVPQFGGVVLLDPPTSLPSTSRFHLPVDALTPSFHLFIQHLYSLLALPPLPSSLTSSNKLEHPSAQTSSALIQPLTAWQVHQVLQSRAKENSLEARKTLKGISRLVKKIREMKVGRGVRGKVLGAVERLEQLSTSHNVLDAFILTRDAVTLANEAFFDPSMMGLLYFPDEHKFAVYTPLFAPIAVPLIVGLLKELAAWRKRRRSRVTVSEADIVDDAETNVVTVDQDALEEKNAAKEIEMEKIIDIRTADIEPDMGGR